MDLDFLERVYRRLNGRRPVTLREDFCGTASLASAFAARRSVNRAWGVDLHRPTLEWGWRNRVELEYRDVRSVGSPPVDLQAAFNFWEGWDADTDEPNGTFRRRTRLANEAGWVVYLVARR